ncbi:MAG: thiamine diphosphokinase [Oscillospiraceae bacterium]
MSMICCIVGAGDMTGTVLEIPVGARVIAADGGLSSLEAAHIIPNVILGDFDSLGRIPQGDNVIVHNHEKDDTDTMLAVKQAIFWGADTIIIYGGLGGRFDHSIANLQALAYIANHGAKGYLVGCGLVCTVIKNGSITFDSSMDGVISVFSMGNAAEGVDLSGLKYPLSDYTLTYDTPIGISNEFTGADAMVSVKEGQLTVIWNAQKLELEKYTLVQGR